MSAAARPRVRRTEGTPGRADPVSKGSRSRGHVRLKVAKNVIFLILAMSRRSYLVLHTSSSPDGPHSSGFSNIISAI